MDASTGLRLQSKIAVVCIVALYYFIFGFLTADTTVSAVRYLKVEVDEQDTQSKDNAVTEMYVTVLDWFHIALRKVSA